MNLDVERSDWMRSPGRFATLILGPLLFYCDTADGGRVGFDLRLGRWSWGWALDGR